jgi:hypothetical protein
MTDSANTYITCARVSDYCSPNCLYVRVCLKMEDKKAVLTSRPDPELYCWGLACTCPKEHDKEKVDNEYRAWCMRVFDQEPPSLVAGSSFKVLCEYWDRWRTAEDEKWYGEARRKRQEEAKNGIRFGMGEMANPEFWMSRGGRHLMNLYHGDPRPVNPNTPWYAGISRSDYASIHQHLLRMTNVVDVYPRRGPDWKEKFEGGSARSFETIQFRKRSNSDPGPTTSVNRSRSACSLM